MKNKLKVIITLIFLGFSHIVSAGIIFIPIEGFTMPNAGFSEVKRTVSADNIFIEIRTRGLSVIDGLQAFSGNYDLFLKMTFPINADVSNSTLSTDMIEGRIQGNSRGQIEGLRENLLNVKAQISGQAYCTGPAESPCNSLAIIMDIRGILYLAPLKPAEFSAKHAGSVQLKVMGDFFAGNDFEQPSWQSWDYTGKIGLLPEHPADNR